MLLSQCYLRFEWYLSNFYSKNSVPLENGKIRFLWQTDPIKLMWKISSTLKLWHSLTFTIFPGFLSLCLISAKKRKGGRKIHFWQIKVVMLQQAQAKSKSKTYMKPRSATIRKSMKFDANCVNVANLATRYNQLLLVANLTTLTQSPVESSSTKVFSWFFHRSE